MEVKTMNLPTAAGLFMRPITIYGGNNEYAIIKENQEQMVMDVLSKSAVSLSSCDLHFHDGMEEFPLTKRQSICRNTRVRAVTNTLMRLERKGKLISTLYKGRRYYSIPLSADDMMKNLLMGGDK